MSNLQRLLLPCLALLAAVWLFFGGGMELLTKRAMKENSATVAANAIAEYEMAKRNGDPSACFKAGMAAAAFLSAQLESDYRHWKGVQDDCDSKRR